MWNRLITLFRIFGNRVWYGCWNWSGIFWKGRVLSLVIKELAFSKALEVVNHGMAKGDASWFVGEHDRASIQSIPNPPGCRITV